MEAWKLRVLVYGLLAVVAALVVAARVEHDGAAAVPSADVLRGSTSQGWELRIDLRGRRLASFRFDSIWARCRKRGPRSALWEGNPADGTAATYSVRDGSFDVHQHYRLADIWMHGRVSKDGREVSGKLAYTDDRPPGRCDSGVVRFSASR